MSSAERVWVNLWDSKGAGHQGARTHSVKLPEDAIVEDVIDAIHAKNSGILAGIVSAQLTVFRNAAHFSARETEGPLEEDAELGVMGKSKKDALIVLVPSPSPSGMCRPFVVSNTAQSYLSCSLSHGGR